MRVHCTQYASKATAKIKTTKQKKKPTTPTPTIGIMSVVTIDEIENLPNRPEVLLIDVRDPPEIKSTGLIPTSINIPCKFWFHFNRVLLL